jgi:hypothetical protein
MACKQIMEACRALGELLEAAEMGLDPPGAT